MLNYVVLFVYFASLLTLHESILTAYSNIGDILSRLFMNDLFLNSYYLLWTSFWYLPTFLLISFSAALVNYSKKGTGYFWLIMGITLLVVSLHYQNLNIHNYYSDSCGVNFNTLLSNSVNKYHPALFYITLFHLFAVLQLFLLDTRYRYELSTNLTTNTFINNSFLPMIIFTLFLGSWWALQEGSWGGWWNWDPSEVFGLFVMLYYLYLLHKSQKINSYPVLAYYLKLLTKLVAITYVFIQLNFDLVSHNFGTKVDQFVDTSQNFLITTAVLIFMVLITISHLITHLILLITTSFSYVTGKKRFTLVWHYAFILVIVFILLSSFALLVNDFLWKLLAINVFNNSKLTYFYTSLVITVMLLRLWNTQILVVVLPIYTVYFSKEILLLSIVPTVNKANLLHIGILSLLFIVLSESNQTTSFWEILYENISYVQAQIVNDVYPVFISLNNFMIECSLGVLSNNKTSESVWNFVWFSSSNEGHSFLHSLTPDVLSQALHSGNGLSNYMINVLDFYISSNNFMTVLMLIVIHHVIKTRKLIMS